MTIGTLHYMNEGLALPITSMRLTKGIIEFVAEIKNAPLRKYNFGGPMRIDAPDGTTIISATVGPCPIDNTVGQVNGTIYVSQTVAFVGFGNAPPCSLNLIDPNNLDWDKYEPLFTEIEEEYG